MASAAPEGPTVRLDRYGFSVQLPAGKGWEHSPPYRRKPWSSFTSGALGVSVRIEPISATCKEALDGMAKVQGSVQAKAGVSPKGWSKTYLVDGTGSAEYTLCSEVPAGLLLARYFSESGKPADAKLLHPLLEALKKGAETAPARGPAGSRTLALGELDVMARTPDGASEWLYFDSNLLGPGDTLVRLRPAGLLIVTFKQGSFLRCQPAAVQRPTWLPERVTGVVRSESLAGEQLVSACSPVGEGALSVEVRTPDNLGESDQVELRQLIDGVAQAAGARAPGEAAPTAKRRLAGLGVEVELPAGGVEWSIRGPQLYKNYLVGPDELTRTRPATPYLSIKFERARAASCAAVVQSGTPDSKQVERPAYLPAKAHPTARESRKNRALFATACLPTAGEPIRVHAYVAFASGDAPAASDLAMIAQVVDSVAAATGADHAKYSDEARLAEGPKELVLPVTGWKVPAVVGKTRWAARRMQVKDGRMADMLERIEPRGAPRLNVRVGRRDKSCAGLGGASDSRYRLAPSRPAWLPDGFDSTVYVIDEREGEGLASALLCADLPRGSMDVLLMYRGPLDAPDVKAATELLSAVLSAARPVPSATATPGGALVAPRPIAPAGPFDLSGGLGPPMAFLIGQQVAPEDDRFDKIYGGVVRIEGAFPSRDAGSVDFATDFTMAAGYDSKSAFYFDLGAGIGFSLALGPLRVAPLVGVGIDGSAGAADEAYAVPIAGYYSYGARARVGLGRASAIDLAASRRARAGNGDTRTVGKDDVPVDATDQTWLSLSYVMASDGGALSLGARYVDYGDAKALGLALGKGF